MLTCDIFSPLISVSLFFFFLFSCDLSAHLQSYGSVNVNQSTLPLKDSYTILHYCSSLHQFLETRSQLDSTGICWQHLHIFFGNCVLLCNWEEKCFSICAVLYVSVFYEGREQSQFCLPLVEKCLVSWLCRNNRRPRTGFAMWDETNLIT